jgi:hypothetical protein
VFLHLLEFALTQRKQTKQTQQTKKRILTNKQTKRHKTPELCVFASFANKQIVFCFSGNCFLFVRSLTWLGICAVASLWNATTAQHERNEWNKCNTNATACACACATRAQRVEQVQHMTGACVCACACASSFFRLRQAALLTPDLLILPWT